MNLAPCAALCIAVQGALFEPTPGPVPLDRFHPDAATKVEPARGGAVIVHVPSLPPSLNAMIESSATARQMLYELHESLVRRDEETWSFVPVLAESYAIERDVVFTFRLRDDVKWHDGHAFTARDVLFSYACFKNPHVRCDRKRYLFDKLVAAEQVDARTVRFRFAEPYFLALSTFDESFTLLPAHVYDLADPQNPAHKEGASAEEQGRFVNEHAANRAWIGLGPYRVSEWADDHVEAQRFDGYFEPARGGWLERIRWRAIGNNQSASIALLAGELDYFDRLSSDDYFGERTRGERFEHDFYKGAFFAPSLGMTAWNTARPKLADPRVRTALGLCFDWERFIASFYRGLATRVTGEQMPFGPAYDRDLAPLAFDPPRARALLAEAGWIDRDGDGALDKDGARLSIDYVYPAGNEVNATFGAAFQAELAKIGVEFELRAREPAALAELLRAREFDAAALGLALPFESDPEQLWHSKWARSPSANRCGLADEQVDALIERIQRETDAATRNERFKQLQRRVYELQPALFGVCAARRFALSKRIRGVQLFALDPGYSLRRWFVAGPR